MGNSPGKQKFDKADLRYTKPTGLYPNCEWDEKSVRKMIIDRRVAPRYPGTESNDPVPDLDECPICFLWYPATNTSKCCKKPICTECYLQFKHPNPAKLISCPFCNAPKYAVMFVGPKSKEDREKDQVEDQQVIELRIKMAAAQAKEDKEEQERRKSNPVTPQRPDRLLSSSPPSSLSASPPVLSTVEERRRTFDELQRQNRLTRDHHHHHSFPHASSQSSTPRRPASPRDRDNMYPSSLSSERSSLRSNSSTHSRGPRSNTLLHSFDVEELMLMEAIRLSLLEQQGSSAQTAPAATPPPPPTTTTSTVGGAERSVGVPETSNSSVPSAVGRVEGRGTPTQESLAERLDSIAISNTATSASMLRIANQVFAAMPAANRMHAQPPSAAPSTSHSHSRTHSGRTHRRIVEDPAPLPAHSPDMTDDEDEQMRMALELSLQEAIRAGIPVDSDASFEEQEAVEEEEEDDNGREEEQGEEEEESSSVDVPAVSSPWRSRAEDSSSYEDDEEETERASRVQKHQKKERKVKLAQRRMLSFDSVSDSEGERETKASQPQQQRKEKKGSIIITTHTTTTTKTKTRTTTSAVRVPAVKAEAAIVPPGQAEEGDEADMPPELDTEQTRIHKGVQADSPYRWLEDLEYALDIASPHQSTGAVPPANKLAEQQRRAEETKEEEDADDLFVSRRTVPSFDVPAPLSAAAEAVASADVVSSQAVDLDSYHTGEEDEGHISS
eukprot:GILK01003922.1.p1 GENE.GILK01003922.1~~GILK01003922.1.p1  ORF type:complete len:727 (+),score=120.20 GILK01003922.1:179-2359(+)